MNVPGMRPESTRLGEEVGVVQVSHSVKRTRVGWPRRCQIMHRGRSRDGKGNTVGFWPNVQD